VGSVCGKHVWEASLDAPSEGGVDVVAVPRAMPKLKRHPDVGRLNHQPSNLFEPREALWERGRQLEQARPCEPCTRRRFPMGSVTTLLSLQYSGQCSQCAQCSQCSQCAQCSQCSRLDSAHSAPDWTVPSSPNWTVLTVCSTAASIDERRSTETENSAENTPHAKLCCEVGSHSGREEPPRVLHTLEPLVVSHHLRTLECKLESGS
jgi:hypothetical protein